MSEERATYQTSDTQEAVRQKILNLSNLDLLEQVIEFANTSGVAAQDFDKRRWLFEIAKEELNRRLTPWLEGESR